MQVIIAGKHPLQLFHMAVSNISEYKHKIKKKRRHTNTQHNTLFINFSLNGKATIKDNIMHLSFKRNLVVE